MDRVSLEYGVFFYADYIVSEALEALKQVKY